jgi:hypothetical protein
MATTRRLRTGVTQRTMHVLLTDNAWSPYRFLLASTQQFPCRFFHLLGHWQGSPLAGLRNPLWASCEAIRAHPCLFRGTCVRGWTFWSPFSTKGEMKVSPLKWRFQDNQITRIFLYLLTVEKERKGNKLLKSLRVRRMGLKLFLRRGLFPLTCLWWRRCHQPLSVLSFLMLWIPRRVALW